MLVCFTMLALLFWEAFRCYGENDSNRSGQDAIDAMEKQTINHHADANCQYEYCTGKSGNCLCDDVSGLDE
jgi:hypothetical protein